MNRMLVLALAALTACGGDSPTGTDDDNNGNGDGGNIQRSSITVAAIVDPADASVAQALGWSDGRIPGARVVIRRVGDANPDSALTDESGELTFPNMLEGSYTASVIRVLTAEERTRLPEPLADIYALGGGSALVQLTPPAPSNVSVSAVAGFRGSLAISEMFAGSIQDPGVGSYDLHRFVEIYNNGDSTVYLDGKLLGSGYAHSVNTGLYPCSETIDLLQDPEGIWTTFLFRFPGSGRSHPVTPGQSRVIAIDAIDHTQFVSEALDLSGADFELFGNADVDNPAVPNLQSVGPTFDSPGGHGRILSGINNVVFVAEGVDLAALPHREVEGPSNVRYVRIPRSSLLDVLSMLWTGGSVTELCRQLVHPTIDQQTFAFSSSNSRLSMRRPVLALLPTGRKLVQRTRTSARDFELKATTPGSIP